MRRQDDGAYDYHRYRQLLAEASDEKKRLALIELLIEEKAKDRLAAQRASDRAALIAANITKVLGASSVSRDTLHAATPPNVVPLRAIGDPRQPKRISGAQT